MVRLTRAVVGEQLGEGFCLGHHHASVPAFQLHHQGIFGAQVDLRFELEFPVGDVASAGTGAPPYISACTFHTRRGFPRCSAAGPPRTACRRNADARLRAPRRNVPAGTRRVPSSSADGGAVDRGTAARRCRPAPRSPTACRAAIVRRDSSQPGGYSRSASSTTFFVYASCSISDEAWDRISRRPRRSRRAAASRPRGSATAGTRSS